MHETLHLLVVDDEMGMRLSIERALKSYTTSFEDIEAEVDFRISTADSGEAALELAAVDPPQIILLDYKLPGLSGLDVLQTLMENKSEALVVMITAYASLETAVQATKIGAFDFLAKPFTPIEVKAAVHKTSKHYMIQAQARKLAGERKQIRFEFLSVLAHELKSPLAAVEGNLRILRDHAAGDEIGAYDHLLDRSVLRLDGMRKLIMDLLDLTRIESGQKQRVLSEVDICASALLSLETHQALAAEKHVTVLFCPPGAVMMQADPGELEMMFNNLISNAIKYNREGGSVTVELEEGPEVIRVKVHDTGIGMSQEEVAKLFGEFSRIKNAKTRNILGSGLGLSILKRLASLYGGKVEVESEPDHGSTFTVTLKR
jgi:two-component system, sensor histidine kinase and response regulator